MLKSLVLVSLDETIKFRTINFNENEALTILNWETIIQTNKLFFLQMIFTIVNDAFNRFPKCRRRRVHDFRFLMRLGTLLNCDNITGRTEHSRYFANHFVL